METRYCIEYINPQHPLRDDGSLNIRYDRVLTLEQAEHDLTLILSFGGKILDLYMGNVVDGETGEWSPKPMIINDDDWFSTKWLNTLEVKEKNEGIKSNDLEEAAWMYYDKNKPLMPHEFDLHKEMISFFIAGAQWQKDHTCLVGRAKTIEEIKEALLSEVLPCFMHGGEADEVVAKLDEVLNKKIEE